MKKPAMLRIALPIAFGVIGANLNAQEVIYEASESADFNTWIFVEAMPGNDGFNWEVADVSSTAGMSAQGDAMRNFSSNPNTFDPLNPDDFAISPPMDLTDYVNAELSWARGAGSAGAFAEKYSVYVVQAADEGQALLVINSATPVYEETIAVGHEMLVRTVDISAMDGMDNVYVVFQHHDCTGQFFLAIDDITVMADESPTASINEVNAVELSIYPVPADDFITIKCGEAIEELIVMDAQGRQVLNATKNQATSNVNIVELPSGIYTIMVKTATGKTAIQKFVK